MTSRCYLDEGERQTAAVVDLAVVARGEGVFAGVELGVQLLSALAQQVTHQPAIGRHQACKHTPASDRPTLGLQTHTSQR